MKALALAALTAGALVALVVALQQPAAAQPGSICAPDAQQCVTP